MTWEQTGPDRWRSTDRRLVINRTTHQATRRAIDMYDITVDGRATSCAALTLAKAQEIAERTRRERGPLSRFRRATLAIASILTGGKP